MGISSEFLSDNYELNSKSYENICSICRKLTATIGAHHRKKKKRISEFPLTREPPKLCENRICEICYHNKIAIGNFGHPGRFTCSIDDCNFNFSKKLIFIKNDLTALVFKCPEKKCEENLLFSDFLTHTHQKSVDKEENQKAEETKMSEISLSDVLQKIGDEFERKECEKMAIKDKEIEMLKNLLNEKEKRIDELLADSDKYAATFIDYSSEMELEKEIVKEELDRVNEQFDIVKDEKNHLLAEKEDYLQMNLQFESTKEELEKIKEEFEKIKDENSRLLTMKEDYLQMSNMFGRFNVEWMESKGLSPACKICHEIYDTNEHFQVTLNCGHAFGESCIKRSLEDNKRCPVCNKKAEIDDLNRVY
ncbi:unnamed protein product [Oikopleura dioica]|uniref:RING-type domain-containing protein n=1 Tax=Oikopleura dioica TaxID=34765 RepID=E4YPZ3_OIKDI|nr:unnamed protein product [Oikopleura dioica]